MRRSRIYISTSAWDGLPIVLLEALACGIPIVSAEYPNGVSGILADGACGDIIPVGDEARLVKTILRMLESPPDPEGQRARARDFRLDEVVRQ